MAELSVGPGHPGPESLGPSGLAGAGGDRWPLLVPAQRGLAVLWRTLTGLSVALAAGWLMVEPFLDDVPPRTPGRWVVLVVALAITLGGAAWSWQATKLPTADPAAVAWYRGGSSRAEQRAAVRALRRGQILGRWQRPLAAAYVAGFAQAAVQAAWTVCFTGAMLTLAADSHSWRLVWPEVALFGLVAVLSLGLVGYAHWLRRAARTAGLHLEILAPTPAAPPASAE